MGDSFFSLPLQWGGWQVVSAASNLSGGGVWRGQDRPHPGLRFARPTLPTHEGGRDAASQQNREFREYGSPPEPVIGPAKPDPLAGTTWKEIVRDVSVYAIVILRCEHLRASKDDNEMRASFEARRERGSHLRMTPKKNPAEAGFRYSRRGAYHQVRQTRRPGPQ